MEENILDSLDPLLKEKALETSCLFNISLDQLQISLKEGIDLNCLYLLEAFYEGTDLTKHLDNEKVKGWKQTIVRKGLINDGGFLTPKGKQFISDIKAGKKKEKLPKNVSKEESPFDRWWKVYPATDVFDWKGKSFTGGRSMRSEKDICRQKFNELLNSGEYTEQELIDALSLQVEMKKEESYRSGDNKLKYLPNSAAYLRQYIYEGFVDLVRNGKKPSNQQPPAGGGVAI